MGVTPKSVVKHEHILVRFTTEQLVLLPVQTSVTGRDNRSDRYGEDQRVGVMIMITITFSWGRAARFMRKSTKR
jgi:hypothetical protein